MGSPLKQTLHLRTMDGQSLESICLSGYDCAVCGEKPRELHALVYDIEAFSGYLDASVGNLFCSRCRSGGNSNG